jgi:hypothetical protein
MKLNTGVALMIEEAAKPRGPKRLSAYEIAADRARRKVQRKINRIEAKQRSAEFTAAAFPHTVTLGGKEKKTTKVDEATKHEIRAWLLSQNIRPYHTQSDASQKADVCWDKEWRTFSFKHQWHATMFSMVWLMGK